MNRIQCSACGCWILLDDWATHWPVIHQQPAPARRRPIGRRPSSMLIRRCRLAAPPPPAPEPPALDQVEPAEEIPEQLRRPLKSKPNPAKVRRGRGFAAPAGWPDDEPDPLPVLTAEQRQRLAEARAIEQAAERARRERFAAYTAETPRERALRQHGLSERIDKAA